MSPLLWSVSFQVYVRIDKQTENKFTKENRYIKETTLYIAPFIQIGVGYGAIFPALPSNIPDFL